MNKLKVTFRQYSIIKLIAEEFTDKEIADRLGLSERTVKNHNYNIRQKYGIRTRVGLAVMYVQGIFKIPEHPKDNTSIPKPVLTPAEREWINRVRK